MAPALTQWMAGEKAINGNKAESYPELIEFSLASERNPESYMYQVLPTVEELTGHPARSFSSWAKEYAEDFR